MQFGVILWLWGAPITNEFITSRAPHAAEMGFDTVEVPLEEPGGFDYRAAGDVLADHALDSSVVAIMSEDRDLLHDDPDVRANGREYVRDCVDCVDALGGDRVVGPMYSAVGRTWTMDPKEREQATELLVDQLDELAAYADERSVSLCIEPLNRYETSFLNTVEQTVDVVDRVDHPACRILVDTYHMNIEEKSIPAAIRAAGDRIGHVHACGNDRGAPGDGHVDWAGVADALADVGYDGHAVIESFTPEVEHIATATGIWRPLAESQDALASDGLAFLRDLFAE